MVLLTVLTFLVKRDYFIGTGVLYTLSYLYSQIRTFCEFGTSHRATFTPVSDMALKVTVPLNTTWEPGQHFFLRFIHLGLHALTAHPFTIASIPATRESNKGSKLVFYVQPRGGLTGRLAAAAEQKPNLSVPVLLDGPYGGVKGKPLHTYDCGLIVACGAGASLSLPFVMRAILSARRTDTGSPRKMTQVVIATRDSQLARWYGDALIEYMGENGVERIPDNVTIAVYETGNTRSLGGTEWSTSRDLEQPREGESEKTEGTQVGEKHLGSGGGRKKERLPISVSRGRPDITSIVKDLTLQQDKSVGIAACGPADVLRLVQDEAAAAQLRILNAQPGAREVYLHCEVFS